MTDPGPIPSGLYTHDLLLHDNDDELIEGTRAFVEQGLAAGGHVLVHSTAARVALLREALPSHPRLEYGLDSDLYLTPSSTLFAYQRKLAEDPGPTDLWVTGTVPLGEDPTGHPAWARYEALVNEVLGPYAFHGLCTYDTGALPESTIAAAKATHPCVSTGADRATSPEYQDPADFLNDPLAGVPVPPDLRPAVAMTLQRFEHLTYARKLVRQSALSSSAVARDAIDGFVTAAARGSRQRTPARCGTGAHGPVGRAGEADLPGDRPRPGDRRPAGRLPIPRVRRGEGAVGGSAAV